MAIEYRLRFSSSTHEEVAILLAHLPTVSGPHADGNFEVRVSPSEMPDAELRIEPCGAYYCYYGGKGREMLGVLIERLVSRFGPVTVEDWET